MKTQLKPQSKPLLIAGICSNEFYNSITPELMRSLGHEVHTDENGEFCPLSEREYALLGQDEAIELSDKGVIRFVSAYLIDGKKVINLCDEDYSEEDTIERTLKNYQESRQAFEKIAKAFEVEFSEDLKNNDDGTISEYLLDIYVPMERFDLLQNGQHFFEFFQTCSFESPESIDEAMKAVVNVE